MYNTTTPIFTFICWKWFVFLLSICVLYDSVGNANCDITPIDKLKTSKALKPIYKFNPLNN